jgi:hypothetical protein
MKTCYRFKSLFPLALLLLVFFTGCRSISGYPKQPVKTSKEVKALKQYFSPDVYHTFQTADLAAKTSFRNEVVEARLRVINLYYLELEKALTVERNVENIGVDAAAIGTALAASVIGGEEAKSIMALISGGLVGLKGSIDKHLFYEKTMPALVAQMRAERAKVLVRIREGLKLDATKYSLATALDDLDEYAAAGSIPGAINAVVSTAGAETKEAKALLAGVMIATFEEDPNRDKLAKFWMPDGKTVDKTNQKKIADELAKKGIPEDEIPTVINFPEFKALRGELVKTLGL